MTTITERYIVHESPRYEGVWDVVPSDYGMSRENVDHDLCVAWDDPVTGEGGTIRYEGLDWVDVLVHSITYS